jgi:hypothetical protein
MSNILKKAPICFSCPALLGNAKNGGYQYIAKGDPDLTKAIPTAKSANWNAISNCGATAALQVAEDTYVEVRALRGAYFSNYSRRTGIGESFAVGTFLFPARKPMLVGAFKCFRTWEWDGDIPDMTRNALSIASVGKNGQLVSFHSEVGKCGIAKSAVRIPFVSCFSATYFVEREDELGQLLKSIGEVRHRASYGVRNLFRKIFGSGSGPRRLEGQIQFYVPELVTRDYDIAVPLKRPEAITTRDTYIGYDLQRSRFIDLQ